MGSNGCKLYHYTSEDGYRGISKSKKLLPSSNTTGDAVYGNGVYLTSLAPTENNAKIISNNWDLGQEINARFINKYLDRVSVCLEFNSTDLGDLEPVPGERDIILYPGTIDLNEVPHVVYKREEYEEDDNEQESRSSCEIQ